MNIKPELLKCLSDSQYGYSVGYLYIYFMHNGLDMLYSCEKNIISVFRKLIELQFNLKVDLEGLNILNVLRKSFLSDIFKFRLPKWFYNSSAEFIRGFLGAVFHYKSEIIDDSVFKLQIDNIDLYFDFLDLFNNYNLNNFIVLDDDKSYFYIYKHTLEDFEIFKLINTI